MKLTGYWKGQFTYGEGYAADIAGQSAPFEFYIQEQDGVFTGTCTDHIVRSIPGNESFIEGAYENGFISFIKRYKYPGIMPDPGALPVFDYKSDGIHYTGHLTRKLFSRKVYFKGEWVISGIFRNKHTNETSTSVGMGTWVMEKV
jgi:hypothetical protein